jgi:predicted nucleic acid-binding protein
MTRFAYVDTSILVAVCCREPVEAQTRRTIASFEGCFSSNLLEAELRAVGAREGIPAANVTTQIGIVNWVFPTRPLQPEIERVLAAGHLRGADLWHVACALYLGAARLPVTFFTLDQRQREAAAAVGLPVV